MAYVGDEAKNIKLALFTDASFAIDQRDSKSTSGIFLYLVGPRTFVPITWACKKQGCVSHSSTEAEIVALDAGIRMEGIPAMVFWDVVIRTMNPEAKRNSETVEKHQTIEIDTKVPPRMTSLNKLLSEVDFVPPFIPALTDVAKLVCMQDNDAVIKGSIKGRSKNFRECPRTHRINVDWLWERIRTDPGISVLYVQTKRQLADILTKAQFTDPFGPICVDYLCFAPLRMYEFRMIILFKQVPHPRKR